MLKISPKSLLVILGLFSFILNVQAQKKSIDRAVFKLDKKYLQKDNFKQAVKNGIKLQQKDAVNLQHLDLQLFLCRSTYLNGQILQAEKQLKQLEELIDNRATLSAENKLAIAEVYALFGLYGKVVEVLKQDIGLAELVLMHSALVKSGEFNLATFAEEGIELKITESPTKNLNKKEFIQHKETVGKYRLSKANKIAITVSTDSSLGYLSTYQKEFKIKAKKSTLQSEFREQVAGLYFIKEDLNKAETSAEQALELFLKKHEAHHPRAIQLLAKSLQLYYLQGDDRLVRDKIKEYYPKLSYYNKVKSSVNTIPLLVGELERNAGDGDFRNADKLARALVTLYTNYDSIPFNSVIGMYNKLYNYFISRDLFAEATHCLMVLNELTANAFGEQSGVYALQQLVRAQHGIYYEFDTKALQVFQNSEPWKKYEQNYGRRHTMFLGFVDSKAQGYLINNQYKEQVSTLNEAVELAKTYYGTGKEWAKQLVLLAEAELNQGLYTQVQQYLDQAKPVIIQTEGAKSFSYLTCSRLEAELFENSGRFEEAEDIYKKTFRGLNKLSRGAGVNSFAQPEKMAQVFMLTGDYSTAQKQLEQALKQKQALTKSGSSATIIPTYVLLARLAYLKGDFIKSQQYALKAISIGEELAIPNSLALQQANTLLADIDYSLGDYEYAQLKLRNTLVKQQKAIGSDNAIVANTRLKLALANYFASGEIIENKNQVVQAVAMLKKDLGENSLQVANALTYQGMFEMAENDLSNAINTLGLAKQIYTSQLGTKSRENAKILGLLADVHVLNQQWNEAENFQKSCVDFYGKTLGYSHPDYIHAQGKLARIKIQKNEPVEALKIIKPVIAYYSFFVADVFPYLTEREKSKYWLQLKKDYELYYGLVCQIEPDNQKELVKLLDHRIQTKALQLRSSVAFQKDVRRLNAPETNALFQDWLTLKQTIASNYGLSAMELSDKGVDLTSLENQANQLEKKLRADLYTNKNATANKTAKEILRNLGSNDVLVEVIRFNSIATTNDVCYAYLLTTPNNKLKLVSSAGGQHLENEFYRYYRNAVKLNVSDKYSYAHYWEIIDTIIPPNSRVYFSPDGVYGLMNPETFMDDQGRYVFDKNQVSLLNNPQDFVAKEGKLFDGNLTLRAELVGNPAFYSTELPTKPVLRSLPGTGAEIDSLEALLQTKGYEIASLTQNVATENAVKSHSSPSILHFATHGYFEDENDVFVANSTFSDEVNKKNPLLLSGLVLAEGGTLFEDGVNKYSTDGLLTAMEAKDLDLSRTDIVVLSACETGLGAVSGGEGVFGLQRAFFDAGSSSVVMSLFKVNDQVTAEFMSLFYTNWLTGSSKENAMIEAKKEIKAKYPEPAYWGSFILVSN